MIWTISKNIFALDSPYCKRPVHADDPDYLAILQKMFYLTDSLCNIQLTQITCQKDVAINNRQQT